MIVTGVAGVIKALVIARLGATLGDLSPKPQTSEKVGIWLSMDCVLFLGLGTGVAKLSRG